MLARLLSLYQLVLSVFVYVYLYLVLCASNVYVHENLYQMFSSISVNVVRVCLCLSLSKDLLNSLSTTVSKALLSLCLILSLIIFSKLLYNTQMSYLLSTPSFITHARHSVASMSNFLGLCCG